MGDAAAQAARATPRRRVRAVRCALILALVAVEVALVLPHVEGGASGLVHLRWGWVLAAVACEVVSIATFGRLRRGLLRAGGVTVPRRRMGALAFASSAMNATLPAGAALSAGYLYRQLRRSGVNAVLVAWMLAAAAVVSGLAFTVITMAGTVLDGDDSVAAIAGAGGITLLAVLLLIALLDFVTRNPRTLINGLRRMGAHLPGQRAKACAEEGRIAQVVDQLGAITPRARDWGVAFGFALVNWTADLACFVLCCHAVGVDRLGAGAAVLAYVAGLATSSISVLPGGIGTVEAGMMVGLAHAGVGTSLAVAGILTYRLVAYGLVAAVGWTFWVVLRRARSRPWNAAHLAAVPEPAH
jgi:uncharacterized protein (TIRG00374 family)